MARNSLKNVLKLIDTVNNNVPPEQAFLQDLKHSIEADADKSARKPSRTYKPSSMNCMRASYYQIVGAEVDAEKTSYTLVGIANSGTDSHERIQSTIAHMRDNGIDCDYVDVAEFVRQRQLADIEVVAKQGNETKLYNRRYNISFLCDGIIRYKGHYYILEIKTETSYKWTNRTGVDTSHYRQAVTYSLSLGLNEVLFLYVNRDIFDYKCYLFTVTDDMRQGVVNYIETCNNYVNSGQVPPKSADVAKRTCEYCSYRTLCRSEI